MTTKADPRKSGRLARGFHLADVVRMLFAWAIGTVALAVTGAILPGLWAEHFWDWAWVALAAGLVGGIVRPVLVDLSARIGWIGVFLVAIAGEACVLAVAMAIVPHVHTDSFGWTIAAAFISSAIITGLSWLVTAGTDEAFTASLLRRSRSLSKPVDDPDVAGVVFVQLDGVSFPVLRWAVQSGLLPTISRWLTSESHVMHQWTAQIPCTTPASQLGILHGNVDSVPAFRWYDRELGRVLVANRPADAAIIESRVSDGRGLLADDGVSVSNVFSGDAIRSAMTMSRLSAGRGSRETRRAIAWYLARPDGLARSLTRTIAEVVRERYQARRQRRRDVRPRVHRGWTFAMLRAVSNGVLRDLNTAIVTDEMLRGTRVVYVDYVDYDEIAHHAGVFRPESLVALEAVDEVLSVLERVAEVTQRRYHLVVVSDHGQSQGTIFSDAQGIDLASVCSQLMQERVSGVQDSVESWGRAGALLDDMGDEGTSARLARPATKLVKKKVQEGEHQDERQQGQEQGQQQGEQQGDEPAVVLGSGNLGLVYVPGPERLSLEELDARWPALVPGLAAHPGIGFVACLSQGRPLVVGRDGQHWLDTGEVKGDDPLEPFGQDAAGRLLRTVSCALAPDVYVNSEVNPATLEVAAFEPLVGSHGGLGGWQDQGMLVVPAELNDFVKPVDSAVGLHEMFVAMLRHLGQRRSLRTEAPDAESDSSEHSHP